jgi:hypothetical protein
MQDADIARGIPGDAAMQVDSNELNSFISAGYEKLVI